MTMYEPAPAMVPPVPMFSTARTMGRRAAAPAHVPLRATKIISAWASSAAAAEAGAGDDRARLELENARYRIGVMGDDLSAGRPSYVFGFAGASSPMDIQAIATVTTRDVWDATSKSMMQMMDVTGVAVDPSAKEEASLIEAACVRMINSYAHPSDSGVMSLAPAAYEEEFGSPFVGQPSGLAASPRQDLAQAFRLVTLEP